MGKLYSKWIEGVWQILSQGEGIVLKIYTTSIRYSYIAYLSRGVNYIFYVYSEYSLYPLWISFINVKLMEIPTIKMKNPYSYLPWSKFESFELNK